MQIRILEAIINAYRDIGGNYKCRSGYWRKSYMMSRNEQHRSEWEKDILAAVVPCKEGNMLLWVYLADCCGQVSLKYNL